MDRPEDTVREHAARSLLERINERPPSLDARAPPLATGHNSYQQEWSTYHSAYLAAVDNFRRTPRSSVGINPWFLVLATGLNTIVAAVLAVLITLSVVRQEPVAEANARPSARAGALIVADPVPIRAVELQPIGSLERPLRLEALKPSPLSLVVRPEEALAEAFILILSGVPAKASLQGADRIGADSWMLPPNSIKGLQIVMPEWSTQVLEVGVELRRTSGAFAARTKAWIAVPPPSMPQEDRKLDQAALKETLQKGAQLLGRGDIVAARSVYERAADMGSAEAALALGSTYDPNRLWALGVFGMVGNIDKARHWYTRADQLGHPQGKVRLKSLVN